MQSCPVPREKLKCSHSADVHDEEAGARGDHEPMCGLRPRRNPHPVQHHGGGARHTHGPAAARQLPRGGASEHTAEFVIWLATYDLVICETQTQMLQCAEQLCYALSLQDTVPRVLMCPHEPAAVCASATVELKLLMQHKSS